MNAVYLRRRWLLARPWIKDGVIGLCFVGGPIAFMYALGHLADFCSRLGWCA